MYFPEKAVIKGTDQWSFYYINLISDKLSRILINACQPTIEKHNMYQLGWCCNPALIPDSHNLYQKQKQQNIWWKNRAIYKDMFGKVYQFYMI